MVLQPATTTNRKAVFWSRAQVANDIGDQTSEKEALYSVLLDRKALHSMIPVVSDIEIALSIEGQTSGTLELIGSFSPPVSTDHHSALCGPARPAHHAMIPAVCHIDGACRIDQHSREDQTTASAPSLDPVHRPRQSLLWRPSPTSLHDDSRSPTRRQRVLHRQRRKVGKLS